MTAIIRRGVRTDLKIMAALAVAVTLLIAVIAPPRFPRPVPGLGLGPDLDGMVVVFFAVGAVALLRADRRRIVCYAACVAPPTLLAAVAVAAYAGTSVPTAGFGPASPSPSLRC